MGRIVRTKRRFYHKNELTEQKIEKASEVVFDFSDVLFIESYVMENLKGEDLTCIVLQTGEVFVVEIGFDQAEKFFIESREENVLFNSN